MITFVFAPGFGKGTVKIMHVDEVEDVFKLVLGEEYVEGKLTFDTYEIPSFPGTGLICRDQDSVDENPQRLGIKGPFALIGMERLAPDTEENPHRFSSLEETQAREIKTSLVFTAAAEIYNS